MAKVDTKLEAIAAKIAGLPRLTDRELQVLQQIMLKVDKCLGSKELSQLANGKNFRELYAYAYSYLHWKRQRIGSKATDIEVEPALMMAFGMLAEREGWLKTIDFDPKLYGGIDKPKKT
jgi:hypothetical protein